LALTALSVLSALSALLSTLTTGLLLLLTWLLLAALLTALLLSTLLLLAAAALIRIITHGGDLLSRGLIPLSGQSTGVAFVPIGPRFLKSARLFPVPAPWKRAVLI
jgi:hypothetical protein